MNILKLLAKATDKGIQQELMAERIKINHRIDQLKKDSECIRKYFTKRIHLLEQTEDDKKLIICKSRLIIDSNGFQDHNIFNVIADSEKVRDVMISIHDEYRELKKKLHDISGEE